MSQSPDQGHLLRAAQRCLLGAIGPSWRVVWVGYADGVLHFHPVLDGPATDDDVDASSDAAGEFCADFSEIGTEWTLDEEIWVVDRSQPMPRHPELHLAYLRRGETFVGSA
jgi:hypothetical protein